ncbi:vitamin B12-dependent ribonucleotide reductase [Desulfovibrio oxamicus]|uniref:Vitamin B12-dependent ribonucleotide reductase n=1 Tax=Nitratidesulfovibrio oxamicus TaxID=32016 RepID=A0ABS0J260_9BACT|nr:vitamin B12-dependent ribonucleotide reductase [Nitratidesulfovibrio oxamicus]MBG3876290.1 vitamin B12-dependent ribonucleotide reductase [Nitratidesulfovibrio oxamicus]
MTAPANQPQSTLPTPPATPEALPDVALNPNAKVVLAKRYYRKGPDGTPQEDARTLFWRIAGAIAAEEGKYKKSPYKADALAREFYDLMTGWKFLPNSPTLMNAGTDLGQLSACFVLPVGDSIEEIFDAVKHAAMIHKSGGGTGFSFSRLRPKEARVGSTGGVASGPVSFLRIFNTATEQIKQGGTRRGANMGILRIDHPDIIEFIRAKERDGEFNNFNLSVGLTEAFMKAVEADEEYDLVAPHTGQVRERLKARKVFEMLVQKAWESGDPGIVFLDRINRDNPTPKQGEIESTNPCGEQPLLPYEACNLGSINLSAFFVPGTATAPAPKDGALPHPSPEKAIDWAELKRVIHLGVRFLDNVIDASRFPLERITETVHRNRKIGLGVMGWADLLYQLGIPYDSQEAISLGERMMQFVQDEGRAASKLLAKERGPFPAYAESTFAERDMGPYRNATVTTIAPTGTLSIIAGCSSGIEPLFALCFSRNVMDGERLVEVNPHFEAALRDTGSHSRKLMEAVAEKGTIQAMDHLPEDLRRVYVTAMDIAPVWHLRMQAAFQKYTDNAVSKTVNLPNSASIDDIRGIYWMAYEQGCKGVTVYRDGCKAVQVLCTGEGEKKDEGKDEGDHKSAVRQRPDIVYGFTQKVPTGLGAMYLTVNEANGKPFEVFATIGKSGRSITAKAEAIGRLVSLALRSGVEVRDIVQQLKGIGGEHPVFQKKGLLLSIPDAISWVLENRYLKGELPPHGPGNELDRQRCPDCGEDLVFQEGCYICPGCGFTKCG